MPPRASSSSATDPPPAPPPSTTVDPSSRPSRKSRLLVPADSLLNFNSYTPPRRPRDADSIRQRRTSAPLPPRSRDAFVQANYRFAVSPVYNPAYQPCTALHDALVPWHAVDLVFVTGSNTCPICLQRVRCPRVTPCGHVFDFTCILQHLFHASPDPAPHKIHTAKCPMCSSRIAQNELKPCVFRKQHVLELGLPFQMQLVARHRASMIATLYAHPNFDRIPNGVTAESPFYSRLGFAHDPYLLRLADHAIEDLRNAHREDPDLELFVHIAVSELNARKAEIQSRTHSKACSSAAEADPEHTSPPRITKDLRFFYQATDTQNVFLHPVNHRCLSTEFASDFSKAPTAIEGSVLQIERHTMDDQLRKKYRFLDHLPDGCEYAFVELNLNNMLSARTLEAHEVELRGRKASRKRKESQDKKETRRIERKKTQSLQSYFGTEGGYLARGPRNPEQIDSRDIKSFPALGVGAEQSKRQTTGDVVLEDDRVTDPDVGGPSASGTWDGSDLSSYSSVTSKMGLFPTLGTSSTGTSPGHASFPTLGDAKMGTSPGRANGSSPWFPTSPQTRTRDVPQEALASGSGCRSQSAAQQEALPAETPRKGKKSHRKTTILSNASVPYRR